MTPSNLTILAVFLLTLGVALIWGVRWAYVAVFLPVLVLLNQLPWYQIQHAPVSAESAPMYAILLALPFRGQGLSFRWCWTDTVVVLLTVSAAITGWTTQFLETGVNALRNDTLRLAMPYFLARGVFQDWHLRRAGMNVLIAVLGLVTACAVVEFLFTPNFYLHILHDRLYMGNSIHPMAMRRFGFSRVSGTVEHPIFFGNMALVMLGMVAVLARTAGQRLLRPWVAAGLLGAAGCVGMSGSWTPYMGVLAGSAALVALLYAPAARRFLLPLALAVTAALYGYTYHLAHTPLAEHVVASAAAGDQFRGSMETRHKIVLVSWPVAIAAGPFGFGMQSDFSDVEGFDLSSVDNSYMQFTMTRGWVYTLLWVGMGVTFAARATRAFRHLTDPAQVFPLAVCSAIVLGLMVSMYTVWAGAVYAVVWIIMLGLSHALIDAVLAAAEARQRARSTAVVRGLRPPTVGGRVPVLAGARYGLRA